MPNTLLPSRLLCACVLAALVCSLSSTAAAQARRGPVAKPVTLDVDPAQFDASRVIVKFREASGVRLRGRAFATAVAGVDLAAVNALRGAAVAVERVFERDAADLDRERAAILRALPERHDPPADLNLYYRWIASSAAAGKRLCRALNALDVVEVAFPDHRAGIDADPDDIPPTTPLWRSNQRYFDAPPAGIDVMRAHVIPGARGEQLQILDIETGLIVDHEDVPEAVARNVIGANPFPRDHGLAVAGEMVAGRNAYGVTGGVYEARYKFHSHQARNWASSVSVATQNSRPGDIIVLEVQLSHPVSRRVVPMEVRQDVFDAVRTATLRGIHVIAAAGNGSQDLDAPVYARIFDRTFRDSGAIIIGATEGVSLARASFSNYGSIVDANGWGRNVYTTGYGDLFYPNRDARQKYTVRFSGTSSATPIATSAAAAVLSAAKQQLGRVLTPLELRNLMRAHGTAVPNGRIGVRPDLRKLLGAIGLPDGLYHQQIVRLGQRLQLDVSGRAGFSFALFLAAGPGELQLPFGRALLDSRTVTQAAQGTLSQQGTASVSFTVPTAASLVGLEPHWQAVRFGGPGTENLTSSLATLIER